MFCSLCVCYPDSGPGGVWCDRVITFGRFHVFTRVFIVLRSAAASSFFFLFFFFETLTIWLWLCAALLHSGLRSTSPNSCRRAASLFPTRTDLNLKKKSIFQQENKNTCFSVWSFFFFCCRTKLRVGGRRRSGRLFGQTCRTSSTFLAESAVWRQRELLALFQRRKVGSPHENTFHSSDSDFLQEELKKKKKQPASSRRRIKTVKKKETRNQTSHLHLSADTTSKCQNRTLFKEESEVKGSLF